MADPKPGGNDDVALGGDTTKRCPACGGSYSGETHKDCPGVGGTIKVPSSSSQEGTVKAPSSHPGGGGSSKPRLDDFPAEVQPHAADPSRQLNQYILVKQIGKGGMGTVWKAWDRKLTRWVAIKFLIAAEDEDVARFQREAKLAARLRHPNIAPIYEVGEAPSLPGQPPRHYLAMEFIDGQSLANAINLPLRELLDIFLKVAQGVDAAHRGGVVHRDLKPQNVMLTSDRWPYVMDFGLAKALQTESSISVSGAVMGTPAYMPPEQAQGHLDQIDGQSDVYSLGATIYAVLCKKQPFAGQTPMEVLMKVCKDAPPAPRKLNAEIPEPVERIILEAMAKEKVDRYATAGALAEDLKRVLNNQEVAAQGPSSVKLAARKVKGNPWPLVAGLAVLLAGGVVGFMALRPKPEPPPAPPADPEAARPTPVVPAVDPEAETRRKREELERAWQADWLSLRPRLDFDRWKPDDAALGAEANRVLARMKDEAALRDAVDETDWLEKQAREVLDQAGALGKDKGKAARIIGWCDALAAATKDVERLKPAADLAARARAQAVTVVDYRGSFTLRVFVGPAARLTKFLKDGKPADPGRKDTPFVLPNLEIADYELEFAGPGGQKKSLKIEGSKLKDAAVYTLSGHLADPAPLRLAP